MILNYEGYRVFLNQFYEHIEKTYGGYKYIINEEHINKIRGFKNVLFKNYQHLNDKCPEFINSISSVLRVYSYLYCNDINNIDRTKLPDLIYSYIILRESAFVFFKYSWEYNKLDDERTFYNFIQEIKTICYALSEKIIENDLTLNDLTEVLPKYYTDDSIEFRKIVSDYIHFLHYIKKQQQEDLHDKISSAIQDLKSKKIELTDKALIDFINLFNKINIENIRNSIIPENIIEIKNLIDLFDNIIEDYSILNIKKKINYYNLKDIDDVIYNYGNILRNYLMLLKRKEREIKDKYYGLSTLSIDQSNVLINKIKEKKYTGYVFNIEKKIYELPIFDVCVVIEEIFDPKNKKYFPDFEFNLETTRNEITNGNFYNIQKQLHDLNITITDKLNSSEWYTKENKVLRDYLGIVNWQYDFIENTPPKPAEITGKDEFKNISIDFVLKHINKALLIVLVIMIIFIIYLYMTDNKIYEIISVNKFINNNI